MGHRSTGGSKAAKFTPQDKLVNYLQDGDMDKFQKALTRSDVRVNFLYPYPHFCTCLHIAVKACNGKVVELLLKQGADCDLRDGQSKTSLHLATELLCGEVFQLLLNHGANVNAKDELERSCLHLAVLGSPKNPLVAEQMLKAALSVQSKGVNDLDCTRSSPLVLAAQQKSWNLCRVLLDHGADPDSLTSDERTARHWIESGCPELLQLETEVRPREPGQLMYEALMFHDVGRFHSALDKIMSLDDQKSRYEALNCRNSVKTPVEYAIFHKHREQAIALVQSGAEIDLNTHQFGYNAFQSACANGDSKILEVLVQACKRRGVTIDVNQPYIMNKTVMHLVTENAGRAKECDVEEFVKCAEILLEYGHDLDLDTQDEMGNTPLHYAALLNDHSLVLLLLKAGASLSVRNKFGTSPISRISESTLRSAFDHSIRYNEKPASSNDLEIILDYSMLIPPGNTDSIEQCVAETIPLSFIGQSAAHQTLLLHPLVESFLAVKWRKLRVLYWISIVLYCVYTALLTVYMLLVNKKLLRSDELTDSAIVQVFYAALCFVTLVHLLYEISQMTSSLSAYARHVTNYLQLTQICIVALLLLPIHLEQQLRTILSAWSLILAWITLVFIIGRHPSLSQYYLAFGVVALNFAKFIALFACILIAFTLGFWMMFPGDTHFATYWRSQVRVVAMTLGELEYTSLRLDNYTGLDRLAFVLFVFLVSVVLMNVLNGLAVSDTAQILAQAQLNARRATVQLILHAETLLLSLPGFFRRLMPAANRRLSVWLLHRTLLFPRCLTDKQLLVRPNMTQSEKRFIGCTCHQLSLSERLVESLRLLSHSRCDPLSAKVAVLDFKMDALLKEVRRLRSAEDRLQ